MPARTLVAAATGSYAVNVALYIVTATLTLAATATGIHTAAGRRLVPALVPLAVIPFAGTHGRRHYGVAASAAPFYALAALVRS